MEVKVKTKCSRLQYQTSLTEPVISLMGIVVSQDSDFLVFKTRNKSYRISQRCVLSLESTNIDFQEAGE